MAYDYRAVLEADICSRIENYKATLLSSFDTDTLFDGMDIADIAEWLWDMTWDADSVTGNGSGSYTFNAAQARENLEGNEDLLKNVVAEFGLDAHTVVEHLTDWEYMDVSVRCSLLGEACYAVAEEIADTLKKEAIA